MISSHRPPVSSRAIANVAKQYQGAETIPHEVIVKTQGSQLAQDFAADYDAKLVERFDMTGAGLEAFEGELVRLKLPENVEINQALAALREDERIAFAEPNLVFRLEESIAQESEVPDDLHEKLWGLHNTGQTGGTPGADVKAKEAWAVTKGDGSSQGPLIAVIDSGIDYNHKDLKANMWVNPGEIPGDGIDNDQNGVIDDVHGYNAFTDNGDPMDGNSHGTHCAGTIGAVGNNGEGVTGVMQDANLMAVKIFGNHGQTSTDAIVRGILYSAKMGADITSNSWGGGRRSEAIYEAFKSHPGLHVVAAGNSAFDNDRRDNFPSNYDLDNIVAVAATNHIDQRASFSQWGAKKVDVAAPGRNIWSTVPGDEYRMMSGTSMATPHVTGGAGLILSAYPEASNAEIKNRLIYGSERMPSMLGVSVSNGRADFANSLEDDSVAPGAPNDFEVSHTNTRGGQVTWTSVGDDKWANGAAPLVELWSSSEPLSADNLSEAQVHMLEGAAEVGDLASYEFRAETSETATPVHFAMRSVDNVGNASEVLFASGMIPAADVPFRDDFDGQSTGFTATGDFKLVEVEGRGQVYSSRPSEDGSAAQSRLTSQVIDLTDRSNATLKFDYKSDFGHGERATVFASSDGENWTREAFLKRNSTGWREQAVDISEYDGQQVYIRFEVDAKEGKRFGGMRLDNLRLLTEPT